jgi:cyanophycinase-like exopeptidase
VGIDQHFSARKRFKDMTAFMAKYPQFLGIGLDESTAIVVRGSTAEILGKGSVYFYDRKKPITDDGKDYEAYSAGTKYDLAKRRKIGDAKPAEK